MGTAFTIYTVFFITYWIVTLGILVSGRISGKGIKFMEFMRFWVKPLFWMNFAYFAVLETIFSAIYWFSFSLMKLTGFMRPMNALFRSIEPPSGSDSEVFAWLVISVVLFMIVMIPYIFIHVRLTKLFKNIALKFIALEFGATDVRLKSQAPNKLLPIQFVQAIIGSTQESRKWIKTCFKSGKFKKFQLATTNTDHFFWVIDEKSVDFWESQIQFNERRPEKDSEGRLTYSSNWATVFDGIVIRIDSVLPSEWDQTIVSIPVLKSHEKLHRKKNTQAFFIGIIERMKSGGGQFCSEADSSLKDYPKCMPKVEIHGDHRIHYVGVEGRSIFLFVTTNMTGTMFDFNMNLTAKASLEMCREDLQLVYSHINILDEVINCMESWKKINVPEVQGNAHADQSFCFLIN